MSHRRHLTQVSLSSAFKESLAAGYGWSSLRADILAGLSVGIIAIPLSMALAIASGVAPQYGLYTAIIAGILIPLTGGSRLSISGPTAAFVVILFPIVQQHGLSGLLLATLMAGLMLIGMALARLGRLIEYIPRSVTLGFTAGIAVVIAVLQGKDFLGLPIDAQPAGFIDKISLLAAKLPQFQPAELTVGMVTLGVLLLWSRLRIAVPGHLPAVGAGVAASLFLTSGQEVATIGSSFSYLLEDGSLAQGIPPLLPELNWPWAQPGPDGHPIDWDLQRLISLLPAAFSIAMLGAIESLLCAVVLDGMTGQRHHSNGELLGQGIGNLVVPWFGGITATAALARSAANWRAGGRTPLAGVTHGLVVLVGLLVLAPWLAYIPMASMAALLLVVAWNMSEADKAVELLRKAPMGDILVFLCCFGLTVLVDMVVAISCGVVLASLLFMRDIARMTRVVEISQQRKHVPTPLPSDWGVYKISGPLFFAAADRVFDELEMLCRDKRKIIIYMDAVPVMDAGGVAALTAFVERQHRAGHLLIVADLQFQPLKTIARARLQSIDQHLLFAPTLAEALWLAGSQRVMDTARRKTQGRAAAQSPPLP